MHHARTVLRRAERYMTEIAYQEPVNPAALRYANRLSDLLFVLARYLNDKGRSDVILAARFASVRAAGVCTQPSLPISDQI
jgi:cob(I)alamin adenosyltransferase